MKLVHDEREHLLPEDPGSQPSWTVKAFRKIVQHVISSNGITICIGVLLFVLLSSLLSLNYLDVSRYVDKNGISLQQFTAEFQIEVEDVEETERKRERARQNVPLIYQNPEPINQEVHKNLGKTIQDLVALSQTDKAHRLTPEEQKKRINDIAGTSAEASHLFNQVIEKNNPPAYWSRIEKLAHETTDRVLKRGITQKDFHEQRELLISSAIPRLGLSSQDRDFLYFLVELNLKPNEVLDEAAMEAARTKAAESVEPVIRIFKQGEKIVDRGEVVTPVQIAALEKMGKLVINNNWTGVAGVLILSAIFVVTLWGYNYYYEERRFFRPAYAGLITTLVVGTIALLQILINQHQTGALSSNAIYLFPLATLALTLSIFTHHRVGVLTTILIVFLTGLALKVEISTLSVLLFGSLMGVYILSRRLNFRDRGQLMYAGIHVGITNIVMIIAIHFLSPTFMIGDQWRDMIITAFWGFCSGLVTGILTIGILPMLETIFRLVTPYTLLEMGNHDHPLLKRMQFEAPGTFHHSLMVASLAEAAAEAIGADALLTRVGCLYHDIGKMKRPLFFIENQAYFGVENPHDKLTPRLSKMVITAHPRDSLEMAKQHKLPAVIQKFMTEHHGTLVAGYFYNKACQEEGPENVNKSQFRYPGPKPNIKETAIVMLADACESAVRALKAPTVNQIEERIDKIIRQRIEDGQFDNCPLTFKDIHLIKETFIRVLRGIQHNRIEYQQNIIRDLGRKAAVAQSPATDAAKLQEVVNDIKKSTEPGHS